MSAPVVCLPLLGDQPQHVSRVVFRIAGLRLPAFCPYRMPGALMASDTHWSPPPGRSCPDSGPAIATTSLIRLRKRRWRTAGLSGIVAAARVAQR